MDVKSGYALRYTTALALRRDHTAAFVKGRARVMHNIRPPIGSGVLLRVLAPDGTVFDLDAVVVERSAIDVGLSLASPESCRPRAALDMFMRGDRFRRMAEEDRSGGQERPAVEVLGDLSQGPDDELTDPAMPAPPDLANPPRGSARQEEESEEVDEPAEEAAAETEEAEPLEGSLPEGVSKPAPGEEFPVYIVRYMANLDFAQVREEFRKTATLALPYSEEPRWRGKAAELRLNLPGHNIFRMFALVEQAAPKRLVLRVDENNERFRQACLHLETPTAKARMKTEEGSPREPPEITRLLEKVASEDPDAMPIRRRLQRMGMDDKINLALSGNREERMALAMDGNKAIHHYLLRNAKISLDEIAFMARLPTMNPDVLEKIAENPSYTQNPSVSKALVYNPKTPVQTAIRLLDRLPRQEVVNLSKRTNLNLRLVMAAKKKLESKKM